MVLKIRIEYTVFQDVYKMPIEKREKISYGVSSMEA